MAILIRDAIVVSGSGDAVIKGNILIEEDKISAIGTDINSSNGAHIIDAEGRLVTPGLVNAHMHLYSTFARGLAIPGSSPSNFKEILEKVWWRLDERLTLDDVYHSAKPVLIEGLKRGVTTMIDHHASYGEVTGSLETLARAFREIGQRGALCYEISDRNGPEARDAALSENAEFINSCAKDGRIAGLVGLHASFTLEDETLDAACDISEETGAGIHIHVAEDILDEDLCMEQHDMRVIERLNSFDLLNEKSILAHCVHINEHEMDIIATSGCRVVFNPESNANNAVGAPDILEMIRRGIRVCIGTDGMSAGVIESARAAYLLQRHISKNPSCAFGETLNSLLQENALLASQILDRPGLGVLAPGNPADIVVWDYFPCTPVTDAGWGGHLFFGLPYVETHSVIADGEILREDKTFIRFAEDEVMRKSREQALDFWSRF